LTIVTNVSVHKANSNKSYEYLDDYNTLDVKLNNNNFGNFKYEIKCSAYNNDKYIGSEYSTYVKFVT